MRQFVIRSLTTTGVIASLLFTGAGVAAAQPEDDGSLLYEQELAAPEDDGSLLYEQELAAGPTETPDWSVDPTEDEDWSGP
jgi:hypothetical protein